MNIKKLFSTVSYNLMTLRPNIKRKIFNKKEIKKCNSAATRKLNILFGVHPVWQKTIQQAFLHSSHELFFENFSENNLTKYDLVIPLNIPELIFLNKHVNLISENLIPIPSAEAIEICDDKLLFYETLNRNGFEKYLPKVGNNFSYPYVVKKKVTHFGMDSEIIFNQQDEIKYAPFIQSQDYFTQEYISGKNEFAAHILFRNGKIVRGLTIKHVHQNDIYIRGHEKEKTIFSEITTNRFLPIFSDILQCINFEGFCCIDYKIAKGALYILEINPRIGSSCIEYLLGFVNAVNTNVVESN